MSSSLNAGAGVDFPYTGVEITVFAARNLMVPNKDGSCDPYTVMQLDKQKFSTDNKSNTRSPNWNEACDVQITNINSAIQLSIYSKAKTKRGNAFIGRATIPLLDLPSQPARPRWYRLEPKPGKELPNEDEIDRGEVQAKLKLVRDPSRQAPSSAPMTQSAGQKAKQSLKGLKRTISRKASLRRKDKDKSGAGDPPSTPSSTHRGVEESQQPPAGSSNQPEQTTFPEPQTPISAGAMAASVTATAAEASSIPQTPVKAERQRGETRPTGANDDDDESSGGGGGGGRSLSRFSGSFRRNGKRSSNSNSGETENGETSSLSERNTLSFRRRGEAWKSKRSSGDSTLNGDGDRDRDDEENDSSVSSHLPQQQQEQQQQQQQQQQLAAGDENGSPVLSRTAPPASTTSRTVSAPTRTPAPSQTARTINLSTDDRGGPRLLNGAGGMTQGSNLSYEMQQAKAQQAEAKVAALEKRLLALEVKLNDKSDQLHERDRLVLEQRTEIKTMREYIDGLVLRIMDKAPELLAAPQEVPKRQPSAHSRSLPARPDAAGPGGRSSRQSSARR